MPPVKSEIRTDTKASKPYDPSDTYPFPHASVPSVTDTAVKATKPKINVGGTAYNKRLLVSLILKSAAPPWQTIAATTGKTETRKSSDVRILPTTKAECKDIWRKIIQPSLISGKVWSSTGAAWRSDQKIALVCSVLESCKPDWQIVSSAFEGRTKTQVHDVWRKIVLPKLKRGEAVE